MLVISLLMSGNDDCLQCVPGTWLDHHVATRVLISSWEFIVTGNRRPLMLLTGGLPYWHIYVLTPRAPVVTTVADDTDIHRKTDNAGTDRQYVGSRQLSVQGKTANDVTLTDSQRPDR